MTKSSTPQATSNGQESAASSPDDGVRARSRRPAANRPECGPFQGLLDLFSSIWLGVILLAILFIYSSIGSAGLLYPTGDGWAHEQIRQWRGLEMTEFEWFHWWPFDAMIVLICINITVATLRRIPFNTLRLGVWMIHTGIIILCIGSVIYFGTKVEGDAPVARRLIMLEAPGADTVEIIASPGQSARVGRGNDAYTVTVSQIDPQWEILSGENAGDRAYSVFLDVIGPEQQFTRQLLAGFPQHTEDIVRTDDPVQPMQRAKKVNPDGDPLVDKQFGARLTYAPQEYMYLNVDLNKDWAIYLRELGRDEWVQRPIRGMPKYNEYIASLDSVFLSGDVEPPVDPLDIAVTPTEDGDPMPDTTIRVRQYLPFAIMESQQAMFGTQLSPIARLRVQDETGRVERYELIAFDPQANSAEGGALALFWADSIEQRDAMREVREPALHINVPGASVHRDDPIAPPADPATAPVVAIEGTEYSYRLLRFEDGLSIPGGQMVAVAIVEVTGPERTFERWVFSDPRLNRDLEVGTQNSLPLDEAIEMQVERGSQPAPITLIAGPGHNDLHLLRTLAGGEQVFEPVTIGTPMTLHQDVTLTVDEYSAHSSPVQRPRVLPMNQRERNLRNVLSMINVEISIGGQMRSIWLPFHMYPFQDHQHALRRFSYRPQPITLPDGRVVEIMFSRQRVKLPRPVVLEDFAMKTHEGGFTGSTLSVLNWTSMVRFAEDDAAQSWSDLRAVSVNEPVENNGFWYFQAQWDPPQPATRAGEVPSMGMNYTVLGVGNRNGVITQLVGCCIAVIGMIYTFYIKPIIRRRREAVVRATIEERAPAKKSASATMEPAQV